MANMQTLKDDNQVFVSILSTALVYRVEHKGLNTFNETETSFLF